MRLRCPYCRAELPVPPPGARCGACGRHMLLPSSLTAAARAARRRKRRQLRREAEEKRADLRRAPDPRIFRSPRLIVGLLLLLAAAGLPLARRARPPAAGIPPPLPHQVALRQLDTLATALGRHRFHAGRYPPAPPGLRALLDDPGLPGWNGPYINQLLPDPWGTPYQYRPESNGVPLLFSCGPDRRPGTADDLRPDPAAFDPGTGWTSGWRRAADRLPGDVRILALPPPGAG
jgi:type II secretion system protein G